MGTFGSASEMDRPRIGARARPPGEIAAIPCPGRAQDRPRRRAAPGPVSRRGGRPRYPSPPGGQRRADPRPGFPATRSAPPSRTPALGPPGISPVTRSSARRTPAGRATPPGARAGLQAPPAALRALEAGRRSTPNDRPRSSPTSASATPCSPAGRRRPPCSRMPAPTLPVRPAATASASSSGVSLLDRLDAALAAARRVNAPEALCGPVAAAALGRKDEGAGAVSALRAIAPDYGAHVAADLESRHLAPSTSSAGSSRDWITPASRSRRRAGPVRPLPPPKPSRPKAGVAEDRPAPAKTQSAVISAPESHAFWGRGLQLPSRLPADAKFGEVIFPVDVSGKFILP